MIKFLVKGQNIETLGHEIIAADQIAFVKIHYVFDNSWKPLHKVVQFSQDEFTYNRVLGFDDTSCLLPAELTPGAVKMSLFGYDASASETIRATTVVKTLNIRPSGFDGESESPIPPTPDLYQQLLQKISEKGGNGKSAYEIALEHGFVGTEAEWLESLEGADGRPGKDGVDGKNGIDGKDGRDGADGRDGVDGVTPDMSEYPKKSYVDGELLAIRESMIPLTRELHSHENMAVLDSITAEQVAMFDDLQQFQDSTKYEIQTINEELFTLNSQRHTHKNQSVLDSLTADLMMELQGLQQFEDITKYDIQNIRESVDPVISQAHWHHNLTILNGITAEKIAKWDNFGTQINGLSTRITWTIVNKVDRKKHTKS